LKQLVAVIGEEGVDGALFHVVWRGQRYSDTERELRAPNPTEQARHRHAGQSAEKVEGGDLDGALGIEMAC
jgi:hypothetical protein